MNCPHCGAIMNHHADKILQSSADKINSLSDSGGELLEFYYCPTCGKGATRAAEQAA